MLNIAVFFLSFIDDGLFISQVKLLEKTNSFLFCSYNVISSFLDQFGLVIKYGKTEAFHFSRSQGTFNPPPLDLLTLGDLILSPKTTWYYLSFIFDRKLTFCQHIDFYPNKALSTVKSMKMLDNSNRGLLQYQKHLLYRTCVLPIMLYNFYLWFYDKAPLSYPLNKLNKM